MLIVMLLKPRIAAAGGSVTVVANPLPHPPA
jgi:hypothetical protein